MEKFSACTYRFNIVHALVAAFGVAEIAIEQALTERRIATALVIQLISQISL